ncbi:uncharacterized protein GIQ15_01839 [Arthroderma uncinatum]|uniref:uncharacterized protein n=1 Tax=Arthroderma uncinatum TaxID=74035 RepID=UPI00144A7C9E|nr:uncharacterized protein GIQ15_01839 [Arthroderma uncinatum]KAF3492322.1 hypothetical protein GIQ15_01839 [Arthroderma uncinatum]
MPSGRSSAPQVKRSVSSPQTPSPHNEHIPTSPNLLAQPHKSAAAHKAHRPHVVGAQRAHGRNMSQMNLNKLQRLAVAHNVTGDLHGGQEAPATGRRQHMRKKSAPSSPATSPKTGHHVRWNGSAVALGGVSSNPSMRKNLSTPVLKREGSAGNIVKKGHLLGELTKIEKPEEKKTVGFELAGSDEEEDDEWEDHSSPSTASTRRNSLVSGGKVGNGDGAQQSTLTFTKSPLVQQNNAADMKPEPKEETTPSAEARTGPTTSNDAPVQPAEQQNDVTQRLLYRQHSGMVPPAISSISATATQAPPERSSRVSSFANLSSLGGINQPDSRATDREEPQRFSPNTTSSSTEAGVSRFLINHANGSQPGGRSESDFSTPSSFLPHYQPRTPPSPEAAISKALKSPTSRRRPAEPHSRTQQKLWLQRTATLSTSPSESSIGPMAPAIAAPVNDPNTAHPRLVNDPHRAPATSGGFAGGPSTEGESKRTKKVYERFTAEFSVMHRFRTPVVDSLNRIYDMTKPPQGQDGASQPSTSTPGLLNAGENHNESSQTRNGSHTPNNPSKQGKHGSVRFQNQGDMVNIVDAGQQEQQGRQQSNRDDIDSSGYNEDSDDLNDDAPPHESNGNISHAANNGYQLTEEELLVRRMWNSREVAVPGD